MSINSKMTALADEVRTLGGSTGKLTIDQMTQQVDAANTEVSDQASLLDQAIAALEGKAGGGGGYTDIYDPTKNPIEQGNISSSTGGNSDSTSRIRTNGYIAISPNAFCEVTTNVEQVFIISFDSDKNVLKTSGWQSSGYKFVTEKNAAYVRLTLANPSIGRINPSDLEWMKIRVVSDFD